MAPRPASARAKTGRGPGRDALPARVIVGRGFAGPRRPGWIAAGDAVRVGWGMSASPARSAPPPPIRRGSPSSVPAPSGRRRVRAAPVRPDGRDRPRRRQRAEGRGRGDGPRARGPVRAHGPGLGGPDCRLRGRRRHGHRGGGRAEAGRDADRPRPEERDDLPRRSCRDRRANPDGIILVATNPVDVLTYLTYRARPALGAGDRLGHDPRHRAFPDAPRGALRGRSALGPRAHRGRARRLRGAGLVVGEHRRDAARGTLA